MSPKAYELTRRYAGGLWTAADLAIEEDRIWLQVRKLRAEACILEEVCDYLAGAANASKALKESK